MGSRLVRSLTLVTLLAVSLPATAQVVAAPPSLNFQGRLATPSGNPIPDGTYSVRFSLWDALIAGTEKWNQTLAAVQVKNGTFAVKLDPAPATLFNGNLWLEIKVGSDAALTPRQQLLSVPYALKANSVADGSVTTAALANGSITANKFAAGVFNPLAWLVAGNSGVTSGFLGTTDNNPLELRVNNRRALRYNYVEDTSSVGFEHRSINTLGGAAVNTISAGVLGATVVGGGDDYFTGSDYPNSVTDNFGTVVGGSLNKADGFAFVGGGYNNKATEFYATIVGGTYNTASNNQTFIGGGIQNTASGFGATVPGGQSNTASGTTSFAAGNSAQAIHSGAFVWADNSGAGIFSSTAANQFNVRASGGVRIYTKSDLSIGVTLLANDSSWNSVSDRNAKTAFREIDSLDVLERLAAIPITTWNYKGVENPIRHIGPMAQDFFRAFKVGMDDKHIGTIDADGVALAAIQGLNRKLELSNAALQAKNAELEATLKQLAERLCAVESEQRKQK